MSERDREEREDEVRREGGKTDCTLPCLYAGVIAGIVGWGWVRDWLEEEVKEDGVDGREEKEEGEQEYRNGMREVARRMLRLG
jgi:hypothetical protein